ncbi:MAG TPA: endonuclease/exonuclease/phosphatase family protein [Polyangia bacterium]|jgi:endonuclease/exonuclease/phosphatase family metal-dependent hydrolase
MLKHNPLPRRIAAVIGLCALAGLALAQRVRPHRAVAPAGRAELYRLGIFTWNIGKLYLPFDQRAADSRASDDDLAHIAGVVRETQPDVIALQELKDKDQLDRLLGLLGGEYQGHVPESEINDRRVAILARRPVPAAAGTPDLSFRTVTTSTGRSAEAVSVPLDGRGARALVISIHLDAFSHDERRIQAEEIVDWANRQPEPEIFLCGDFNFDYDFLAGHGAEQHSDISLYRFLTRSFEDLGRGAGGTTILARRLDYIFARTSGVQSREVHILGGKRVNLMDHEPVLGRFEIRRPRPAVDTRRAGP